MGHSRQASCAGVDDSAPSGRGDNAEMPHLDRAEIGQLWRILLFGLQMQQTQTMLLSKALLEQNTKHYWYFDQSCTVLSELGP